jgi:transglutaminase-like putative cysteine protease
VSHPEPAFLAPARFVDSDHPDVVAYARELAGDARSPREKAARLFRGVRDRLRYDPYSLTVDPEDYRASRILARTSAYCVPKAVLLCAVARASGIPARLGFADVRNHLSSEKLLRTMGTDLFVFHGYVELWIDGVPRKASPAFNAELCARFGVPPLEFDGEHDALLQAFDGAGARFMEYVRDRGLFVDLPYDEMMRAFAETYAKDGKPPELRREQDEAFHVEEPGASPGEKP